MGTISLSLPSDGQTIDAADVNTPFNTISAVINGNLDNDNIATAADISGTKLGALTTPLTVLDANGRGGWITGLTAPTSITALGNRSYSIVHPASVATYKTPGFRNRYIRTITAPTQCTSLNGTTQYYSKSSPAGMTFTNNFVIAAWVKLSSYSQAVIAGRRDANNGWNLLISSTGTVRMEAFNGGLANYYKVDSYQSIPLNKWVHVAAQLDMSGTATTGNTNSYILLDGVEVSSVGTRAGTSPTSLLQGTGDLTIGSLVATSFLPGKSAQVAIYSAKVTQATIKASMTQTLTGSETSLISAYSFNGVITDLNTTNANNLTAQDSALATNLDTPFTQTQVGITTGTENYSITTLISSDGLTETVQVAEGDTLPTSGGVSAMAYSTQKAPYGFPLKPVLVWEVLVLSTQGSITSITDLLGATITITPPVGSTLEISYRGNLQSTVAADVGSILLFDDTTNIFQTYSVFRNAANQENTASGIINYTPITGARTLKLRAQRDAGSGTLSNAASTVAKTSLIIKVLE